MEQVSSTKIRVFVDTNFLYSLHENKLSNFGFKGEFNKLVDYIGRLYPYLPIKICIPEIVVQELCVKWEEAFIEKQKAIDETNIKYEKIFRDKLKGRLEAMFEDSKAFRKYISDAIHKFKEENNEIIDFCETPDCFQRVLMRAINKEPPFVTVNKGGKEYHDAGLKDNVIFETILANSNEVESCFITSDSDFKVLADSIVIVDSLNQFKDWLRQKEPKVFAIEIIFWLNEEENKREILNTIAPGENDSTKFEILGYDEGYCKMGDNMPFGEVSVEQVFLANLYGKPCKIRIDYNQTDEAIHSCELLEE